MPEVLTGSSKEREREKPRGSYAKRVQERMLDASLVIFAVILCVVFSIWSPYFFAFRNFMNILIAVSMIGVIATGMTVVIIAKGIDLSVGSTMAVAGCIETMLIANMKLPWWVGMSGALGAGLLIGLFNGILVTRFRIVPFIATLGTMNMVRGLAYIVTNGQAIYTSNPQVEFLGAGRIMGIPVPALILICCFVVMWWFTRYTVYGRYVFSVGGNRTASRLAGINVERIEILLFTVTGGLSALAGMIMIGLSSTSMPSAGDGYNLDVITAVYLGGNSSEGGEGSLWRTMLGVMIIGIINNGMALLSVQPYWQTFAKGCLLVVAVIFDRFRRR